MHLLVNHVAKEFSRNIFELNCNWKNQVLIKLTEGFESPCSPCFCSFREPFALIFFWLILCRFFIFQVTKNISMEDSHLKEIRDPLSITFPWIVCDNFYAKLWLLMVISYSFYIFRYILENVQFYSSSELGADSFFNPIHLILTNCLHYSTLHHKCVEFVNSWVLWRHGGTGEWGAVEMQSGS